MSDIPMRYYMKELVSQPLYLLRGTIAPFEPVGDDTGIMATDDANMIHQLENCIAARMGGVIRIDQPRYDEIKKNAMTSTPSEPYSMPKFRASLPLQPLSSQVFQQKDAAVAEADKPPELAPVTETPKVETAQAVRRGRPRKVVEPSAVPVA